MQTSGGVGDVEKTDISVEASSASAKNQATDTRRSDTGQEKGNMKDSKKKKKIAGPGNHH